MITKSERAELRSLVRQQFRVLRGELEARRAELIAQSEHDVVVQFAGRDAAWEEVVHVATEAARECDRQINDALYSKGFKIKDGTEKRYTDVCLDRRPPDLGRVQLRVEAHSRINAQVQAARLELDRREADLLRDLAVGALETEEARGFLATIPSVGDLVPVVRLAELEASLNQDDES